MKINIASSHRFHLLDLARELDKQGFDVRFYSYVPSSRCERYGLPKGKSRCMLWFLWPFFVFARLLPKADWVTKWRNVTMDYALSWFMRPCDVYIALGTVYLHSFDAAKKKFGAKTIMEWGSKHVDEQQRILASVGAHLNKEYFNERSRKGYDVVDFISIASDHVERSFIERGIPNDKLLKNPYGVDLKDFYPMNNLNRDYDFIMVGNWGLQKGCDLIVEAIRSTGYSFLHVGSIVGDVPFPKEKNFKHHDKVDQKELVNYYNQAKIMLFPSRQDGFGMVLSQALSCNLPIVGSSDCGAPDLKRMVELPEYITIITEHTPQAVIEAMSSALEQYKKLEGRVYAGNAIDELTWKSYSERYSNYLSINALLGGQF